MKLLPCLVLHQLVIPFVHCTLNFPWRDLDSTEFWSPMAFENKTWSIKYNDIHNELREVYDYIIVGAGNSGSVLANRLSENPKVTVLLLEVGDSEAPLVTDVPALSASLQITRYNWNYTTQEQNRACLGTIHSRCVWPRGKGLGGSSIINYLLYTRGNRAEFDKWAAAGNPGWSYEDLLPYFIKIETANLKELQDTGYHGNSGPLSVEEAPFRSKIAESFVRAGREAGYRHVDYNGAEQMGVSYAQQNTLNGWRITSAKAYLEPVRFRKNLHILTGAWVTKILIDKHTKVAQGVEYVNTNSLSFNAIGARREVILTAGALETAKLLILSGIGPMEHLQELNIDVIANLPVGQTLYDHVTVPGPIYIINKPIDDFVNSRINNLNVISQWLSGQGFLTSSGIEALIFMKTSNTSSDQNNEIPDIELLQTVTAYNLGNGNTVTSTTQLREDVFDSIYGPIMDARAFQYFPVLLHPKTRGFLKLKSNNPFTIPLVYYPYFSVDEDLNTMVAAIREAIRITSQPAFQRIGAVLYAAIVPGCEVFQFNSDDYWRCYIMHMAQSAHDQVGTTKMGPKSDRTSVVDARLRIHGFKNLRVADVGILPEAPSGHTSAYSFMIGEKAADMIKADWGHK